MAGTFPTLSDGQHVRNGYVHRLNIPCEVQRFRSGKEQRWARGGLINSFSLVYRAVPWADVVLLRDFASDQKGSFDTTWTIDLLDPLTQAVRAYQNMAFDSDAIAWTEVRRAHFDMTLACTQTVAEAVTLSAAANYPAIAGGVRVQLPFSSAVQYKTDRNELEDGRRVTYAAWNTPLRGWALDYPVITDTEVATLVGMYLGQGGPMTAFTFPDPNALIDVPNSRFEGPLEITRTRKNVNRLTCKIEETRG